DETLQVQPGYSRYLEQILGTTEILGKNCIDLLFGDAELRPDAVKAAASALYFSFGVEPWLAEANACHLITEMQKNGADLQPRFFEISWNLICNEAGVVERVLVAVRDVTLLRLLKQAANEKQREIDIVAQTLEVGIEVLNEFCDMCLQLLDENRNALLADGSTSPTAIAEAFRNLHTLKGNARLHGFTHLVDGLHAAEDSYAARRDDPDMPVDVALLLKHLDAVSGIALQYQDVCQRKLAPLSKARSSRAERTLQEIASLVRRSDFDGESTELLSCIRESLHRLEGASLEGLVAAVQPMLPSLAAELGKATPLLAVQHADLQLRPEWAPVIKDSLVQTLRNSLYHGLEAPADREKTGKPPAGQIEVRVVRGVGAFEVLIADDGLGLALGALRQRGFDDTATDEAIAEIIFQSGVSTAAEANHIAGRGVGLDIVRSRLRSLGGDAVVRFTGEQVGGRRPFAVVLVLPTSAVLPPGRDKRPPVQQKAEEGAFAVVGLRGSTPSDRPRGSTLTPELG
ncbi:MAG: Hpt domain-containing protein, partial [Polyangiaceae bacterium]